MCDVSLYGDCGGDRAVDSFIPLDGNPMETNYWGVKCVRRF